MRCRDIMKMNLVTCMPTDTVRWCAQVMKDWNIGFLPIVDDGKKLVGVVTDRDLALRIVAEGRDPSSVRVRELVDATEVVTIGAHDSAEEAIRTMKEHAVRRLPVIDGHELVGMVSQADVAKNLPEQQVGELVEAISSGSANN